MNWQEIERAVLDCTVTTTRSALSDTFMTRGHAAADAARTGASDQPETDYSLRCSSDEIRYHERMQMLEQRLSCCDAECRRANELRQKIRILEEENNKNSNCLRHLMRQFVDMSDKIDLISSRIATQEDRVAEHLSGFVNRRTHTECQRHNETDHLLLRRSIDEIKILMNNYSNLVAAVLGSSLDPENGGVHPEIRFSYVTDLAT